MDENRFWLCIHALLCIVASVGIHSCGRYWMAHDANPAREPANCSVPCTAITVHQ